MPLKEPWHYTVIPSLRIVGLAPEIQLERTKEICETPVSGDILQIVSRYVSEFLRSRRPRGQRNLPEDGLSF